MDLLAHLDPIGDPHLVAVLCEHISSTDGSFWKVSIAGHGIVEVGFDKALSRYLHRGQVLWIWGLTFLESRHAVASLSAGTRISFRPSCWGEQTAVGGIVELFSGFAGWTHGANLLGKETSYMVEIDLDTARAASAATEMPLYLFDDVWKKFLEDGFIPSKAIFVGDANDDRIWTLLSIQKIRHVLFSTNCQPWSSIGHQRGLHVQAGLNTPAMFRKGRDYGMATMTLENVKGFRLHPHFRAVTAFAEQMGFQIAHQNVDNCSDVLPLVRDRWLGVFIEKSIYPHVTPAARLKAANLHFPSNPFMGGLVGYGALFHEIPFDHLKELIPDEHALERLNDPRLIPEWWGKNSFDGIQCRIVQNTKPWKGLVASYGRQHQLDMDLLLTKGLHTCLLHSASGPRYISPWEAAAALGLPKEIKLPLDLHLCWKLVGNGLSVAHAVLQLSRLHILLGHMSPFSTKEVPCLVHLCRAMQRKGLKLSNCVPTVIGEHRVLIDKSAVPSTLTDEETQPHPWVIAENDQPIEDHHVDSPPKYEHPAPGIEEEFLRPSKWMKKHGFGEITPTVPYEVVEADESPAPQVGLQFLPATTLRELLDQCRNVQDLVVSEANGERLKIVIFSSTISKWTILTWAPHGKTVKKLFCRVFPHFQPCFVKGLIDHDTEIECDLIPYANPFRVIRFCPVDKLRAIYLVCDKNQRIIHPANLTTKVSDWISSFAARFNISPCMMELRCQGVVMPADAFILAEDYRKPFYLHWRVPFRVPTGLQGSGDDRDSIDDNITSHCLKKDPDHDRHHTDDNLFCFAVKHPIWNTIRTVSAAPQVSFNEVISLLLPDITLQSEPIVKAQGTIFPACVKVEELPVGNSFHVELNGFRPYPTAVIYLIPFQVGICQELPNPTANTGLFRRWIRSPFKVQASQYDFPGDMALITIGSAFFTQVKRPQTILVTLNNKVADPCLLVKDTPVDVTIGFRVCPLPGGGKSDKNDLTAVLSHVLQTRGVPAESVEARVKAILAAIPQDQIRSHAKEPEVTFWASLKRLASEHKIRLVTNSELKIYQKDKRETKKNAVEPDQPSKGKGKASKGTSTKGKGKGSPSPIPQVDLAFVQLQTEYLQAEGHTTIAVLPKAEFGVDKFGVTLMTGKEAEAFFPIKSLSTGPLAILALCEAESAPSDLIMLPAINKAGEPILLPIVIHNFGDVPVKFHPGSNFAIAPEVETKVVEVTIRRSLVEDWSKVRDGLQYLASTNPALKGGTVIAHWSFKSYNNAKKPTQLDKANYVHGYFRCKADSLDEVLKNSGKYGIFTVPRDDNHRPDPAFAIIPATEKLEHMLIQAQKHVTTLGVVEINAGYAYRTRRENLQALRRALMPDSVWSEEGQPRAGDEMYVLKHVAIATGAPQLTSALRQLGWDAVGIRPIGHNTWSISAATPPPSPHLLINGHFSIAVPAHDSAKKGTDGFRTLASFQTGVAVSAVPTTIPDEDMGTSSHHQSRMQELKHDLTEHIDQLVEKKLNETKEQVGILTEAVSAQEFKIDRIEKVVNQVQGDVQDQNLHVETRLSSIEQSVTSQGNSMMAQMNGMLQSFQSTLMTRLDALEGGECKRQRKENQ